MFSLYTKSISRLLSTSLRCFSASFDALAREHKLLAANLQKIAETDRKFVSFEPEIWDTQIAVADLEEMYECCEGDEESQLVTENEMKKSLQLTREMERSMSLLNAALGPCSSVYLDFHNGTGGEDASDWTRMLFEMYQNFAKKMEWKSQIVSAQYEGDGLRSGTLQIDGDNVSSYLALETGIHRLVRISPFDKNHRRHTSFASVVVTPSIPKDEAPIQIKKEDLIIERLHSSGPGGQHVNKTESAVRITHVPSGIIVKCQCERSQHQNMDIAMDLLLSKLVAQQKEKEMKMKEDDLKNQDESTWGNQIRSYILHPYTKVKDHRYDLETSSVQDFLDGDMKSYLDELILRKMYCDYNTHPY